jgi:2-alkyl-3-oxoalkanoate reductase
VKKHAVVVLGATNFIGLRVVEALLASDWAEPIAFNPNMTQSANTPSNIYAIVNLAEGSPKSILSQARVAAAIANLSPHSRIVHLSSMTVYGSSNRDVDESTALLDDLGEYAKAQIQAESIVKPLSNAVILRPGCEYGPGCPVWSQRIAHLLLDHRLGDLGLAGDGVCNLVFIDDVVDAILKSIQRPGIGGETFNLAMKHPPTWNEYFIRFGIALRAVPIRRITARRLAIEKKLLAPPLKLLQIAASRGLAPYAIAPPPITPSLLRLCKQRIHINVDRAESQLDMDWTPLESGIAQTSAAVLAKRKVPGGTLRG